MAEFLPDVRLAVDCAMAMLIWLVQLVIYPAFQWVEKEQFHDWHRRYIRTISFIVIPLMFVQAGCIGFQCLEDPTPGTFVSAGAVLAAWLVTFTLSVPCHNRLQAEGPAAELVKRVVKTNWLRTIAWTIALLAGLAA